MPPYTPVKSKAQSRKLFSLAREGKLSLDDAKGKTRAAGGYGALPQRKVKRGRRGPKRSPLGR